MKSYEVRYVKALYYFRKQSTHGHDTVGAVAMDKTGNMAFATSTGGITAKYPGRVGDSPIIGFRQYYLFYDYNCLPIITMRRKSLIF